MKLKRIMLSILSIILSIALIPYINVNAENGSENSAYGEYIILNKFKIYEEVFNETTALVIGSKTPIITADAQYDIENNIINIYWDSTNPNGIFEILVSFNGINFESVETVEHQNFYMFSLTGYCELMYIKVKQVVNNDVTSESKVIIINNSSNYNEETEENLCYAEAFYVSVESDVECLSQIKHSSAITLQYSIHCYLENVESFKVTCAYSNACLLSEKVQYVSVDNPTFELSCTSLKNGRGIVTVKVEAVTDSGNFQPNLTQKIRIVATDTYDYISVNSFEQAEKKCVESQFKNNEINALEYAQRVQNLPYGYDDEYINNLVIDYMAKHKIQLLIQEIKRRLINR